MQKNNTTEVTCGTAEGQKHYINSAMQPVQVAQALMTKEQFHGAMMFNIIKYRMRAKNKGTEGKDLNKANQYQYWDYLASTGKMIDPVKDTLPADYSFRGV